MADGGPPTPQQPPVAPPAVPPVPPMQPPAPPTQLAVPSVQPAVPPLPPSPITQLNWSHFKSEFTGKSYEDVEHIFLGQMIGWTFMHFQRVSKSKDFV